MTEKREIALTDRQELLLNKALLDREQKDQVRGELVSWLQEKERVNKEGIREGLKVIGISVVAGISSAVISGVLKGLEAPQTSQAINKFIGDLAQFGFAASGGYLIYALREQIRTDSAIEKIEDSLKKYQPAEVFKQFQSK